MEVKPRGQSREGKNHQDIKAPERAVSLGVLGVLVVLILNALVPRASKADMKTLAILLLASTLTTIAAEKPLWDGKSLSGWHVIGKGEWKIEDGAIHGMHVKTEKEFSHLVTDRDYTNEEIGRRLSVTRERVRQIEARAHQKLRAAKQRDEIPRRRHA